ncbi:hypothetical protein DW352_25450 [Pseudolabrys taiwanensis]|uniref:Kazal-like domain-containing protein n=1 Tax=Pseudolabrys taiwanensis TaxID=331696 RepID=A0A346A329_9HYPH|nr:hypothetical protein [Pseudolabrys taiwanensis]AXK83576.1 hypothetical protein DW352_25450 [Pseudolabrys taiwanensis]
MPFFPGHRAAIGAIAVAVIAASLPATMPAAAQAPAARAAGGFTVAGVAGRKCACTRDYRPVCALMPNGAWRTFSNACTAACADGTVIRRGKC